MTRQTGSVQRGPSSTPATPSLSGSQRGQAASSSRCGDTVLTLSGFAGYSTIPSSCCIVRCCKGRVAVQVAEGCTDEEESHACEGDHAVVGEQVRGEDTVKGDDAAVYNVPGC